MSTVPTNFVDSTGMTVTAAYLNNLGSEVNGSNYARTLSDVYGSRPAAASSNSGAHYFCTDCNSVYKSNGSAWSKIRIGDIAGDFADPPTSMTSFNLGSGTITTDKDARVITAPSAGSFSVMGEYQALSPTSNYTVTAHFTPSRALNAIYVWTGLVLRDNSGKLITFGPSFSNGVNALGLTVYKWNSATSTSGAYADIATPGQVPSMLRIRDDNTTRFFEYSYDNVAWSTVYSGPRADFLTATQVGHGVANNSGASIAVRMRSFKVT